MEDKANAKVVLPPIGQIGIVVKDVEKTAEYYSSIFGIGPFTIQDTNVRRTVLYGEPAPSKMRIAMAQTGSIEIELIQVLEGGELHTEFLRNKGEGLHHLGIYIDGFDAYDRTLAELADQGIKPIFSFRGSRVGFAYLDTQEPSVVIPELVHIEKGDWSCNKNCPKRNY